MGDSRWRVSRTHATEQVRDTSLAHPATGNRFERTYPCGEFHPMSQAREKLLGTLAELGKLFPDWRFGQLLANVAMATSRGTEPEAIWECEDDELLTAARRLVERNRERASATPIS